MGKFPYCGKRSPQHRRKMRISIIGAGNGGQAMAGHFSMLGHEVTIYNRNIERISGLIKNSEIYLCEAINGSGKLKKITNRIAEAIKDAELIMIATTANAHRDLAEKMAGFLEDEQIIVLNPGRTLGALEFANIVRKITSKRVYIAEAQSLIYACRLENPGHVRIVGVKKKVLFSAYPSKDTDYVLDILNGIYPCFVKADNILKTGLENIGAILHPTVILVNAAAIERGSLFYFYNDITSTIADFIGKVDSERIAIGTGFGLDLLSVSDWVSFAYENIKGHNLCDKMKNNPAYYKILAPNNLNSRLLLEDIPTGILPLVELAKLAHVKTPLMESILNITEALLGMNFHTNGRTLANLGLSDVNMNQFMSNL
jgi:opine dehydrogenase